MKNWLIALFFFSCPFAFAANFQEGFDSGPIPANQVTVDCSAFSLNLSCANTSVQSALNTLDQLVSGSGGGNPGGNIPEAQYKTGASTFSGLPRSTMTSGGNFGIGTTLVGTATVEVTKNSTTNLFHASTVGNHGDIFTITNGANVGIGSITPGQLLDVAGNIRNSGVILTSAGTAAAPSRSFSSDTDTGMYSGGANDLRLATGGTNAITIGTAQNVGIGTIAPADLLNVFAAGSGKGITLDGGAGSVESIIKQGSSAGYDTHYLLNDGNKSLALTNYGSARASSSLGVSRNNLAELTYSGSALAIYTTTAAPVVMGVNNGEWFRIASTGNVGIGTSIPPQSLYVAGTGEFQGFKLNQNAVANYVLTSNAVGIGTWMPAAAAAGGGSPGGTGTELQYRAGASTFGAVTNSAFDGTNVGIGTLLPNALLSVASTASQTLFRVDDNGAGDLSPFIVDANGNVGIGTANTETDKLLVMGGNVGIGTWVPNQTLDVKGKVIISDNVGIGTVLPNALLSVASVVAQDLVRVDDNGIGDPSPFIIDLNGNVGIGTTVAGNAGLSVMNGNVGIGTWKPGNLLTIGGAGNTMDIDSSGNFVNVGGVAVTWNSGQISLNTNGIALFQNTNNGSSALTKIKGGANAASSLQLMPTSGVGAGSEFITLGVGNNGATEVMRVTGGANVGIGSVTPGTKLDVTGAIRASGLVTSVGVSNSATAITNSAAYTQSGTSLNTITGTTNFSGTPAISTSTNVGIGTTSAENLLVVAGNVGIGTNSSSSFARTTPDFRGMMIEGNVGLGTSSNQTKLAIIGNVGIGTWTAVGGNLIINGGGNVGISSAWPGQVLDVNGAIRTIATGSTVFNGNVGMGTALPIKNLQVGGDVFLDRTTSTIWMREPDGTCGSCTLSNAEVFTCVSATCP